MATEFNTLHRVPITRADLFPHIPPDGEGFARGIGLPISSGPMDVTHLEVATWPDEESPVALFASTPNAVWDPYGVEVGLTPDAARLLARELVAAADDAERADE